MRACVVMVVVCVGGGSTGKGCQRSAENGTPSWSQAVVSVSQLNATEQARRRRREAWAHHNVRRLDVVAKDNAGHPGNHRLRLRVKREARLELLASGGCGMDVERPWRQWDRFAPSEPTTREATDGSSPKGWWGSRRASMSGPHGEPQWERGACTRQVHRDRDRGEGG